MHAGFAVSLVGKTAVTQKGAKGYEKGDSNHDLRRGK